MKLGIKVSLNPQSLLDLDQTDAPVCEVWYNASRAHEYTQFFRELHKRKIDVGLHFWGSLPDGIMANIAYPDTDLSAYSLELIKCTVDTAQKYEFRYVNIHPGQRAKVSVDFNALNYPFISEPSEASECSKHFLENAKILSDYSHSRGVIFTVETVSKLSPKRDWYNPESRHNPVDIYDLDILPLDQAAHAGIFIANDFAHTATQSPQNSSREIYSYLALKTVQYAPMTRLIHLGFLVPPFNGVDNHDMLDNPLLKTTSAVPNITQMQQLLGIFKNRSDVWVITEPRQDHPKNYFLAQEILSQI